LGVAPFFLFAILFLLLPSLSIFVRSFEANDGSFTLENIRLILTQSDFRNAYRASLSISVITAIGGGIFGFLLPMPSSWGARTLALSGDFRWSRLNFAGVPLAFAFVATIATRACYPVDRIRFGDRYSC
jgi:putative spermidine/putrescine transport system permease protein